MQYLNKLQLVAVTYVKAMAILDKTIATLPLEQHSKIVSHRFSLKHILELAEQISPISTLNEKRNFPL